MSMGRGKGDQAHEGIAATLRTRAASGDGAQPSTPSAFPKHTNGISKRIETINEISRKNRGLIHVMKDGQAEHKKQELLNTVVLLAEQDAQSEMGSFAEKFGPFTANPLAAQKLAGMHDGNQGSGCSAQVRHALWQEIVPNSRYADLHASEVILRAKELHHERQVAETTESFYQSGEMAVQRILGDDYDGVIDGLPNGRSKFGLEAFSKRLSREDWQAVVEAGVSTPGAEDAQQAVRKELRSRLGVQAPQGLAALAA